MDICAKRPRILGMKPDEYEQRAANSLLRFARSLTTYYADKDDQEAATLALLKLALESAPGFTTKLWGNDDTGML